MNRYASAALTGDFGALQTVLAYEFQNYQSFGTDVNPSVEDGHTVYLGGNYDFGESNDLTGALPYLDLASDNYSFGIFHRSYAGLDPKGRFGLFAEFELSMSTGSTNFAYESGDRIKRTYSDNTQLQLVPVTRAVYIFPNVCATLSFGLGGIQYTSVTQKDAEGHKIGSRKASNMKFKLNIAAITSA